MWFWTPRDKTSPTYCSSQGCFPLFTAPFLDVKAAGNRWVVSFQIDFYGKNNFASCNNEQNPAPCGVFDADPNEDQFLTGTSAVTVSTDPLLQEYWHSHYTYHPTDPTRLIQRVFYQTPGGGWPPVSYELKEAPGSSNLASINPATWSLGAKCAGQLLPGPYQPPPPVLCFDPGDYGQISGAAPAFAMDFHQNAKPGQQSSRLYSALLRDPPGPTPKQPNTLRFPLGADLRKVFPEPRGILSGGVSPAEKLRRSAEAAVAAARQKGTPQ